MYNTIAKSYAAYITSKNQFWIKNPIKSQTKTLETLIKQGKKTLFGQQHFFKDIRKYDEFKESIPVRDYEKFKIYINRLIKGESDIIWPGKPNTFAKPVEQHLGLKHSDI